MICTTLKCKVDYCYFEFVSSVSFHCSLRDRPKLVGHRTYPRITWYQLYPTVICIIITQCNTQFYNVAIPCYCNQQTLLSSISTNEFHFSRLILAYIKILNGQIYTYIMIMQYLQAKMIIIMQHWPPDIIIIFISDTWC